MPLIRATTSFERLVVLPISLTCLLLASCSERETAETPPSKPQAATPTKPAPVAQQPVPDRSSSDHERPSRVKRWPDATTASKDRLEWNRETLVGAYDQVGSRDPRWDEVARELLEEFARVRGGGAAAAGPNKPQAPLARKALEAGCSDPMVAYLGLRYLRESHERADVALAEDYRRIANELGASRYPAVRKFYAYLRAGQAWRAAHRGQANAHEVYGPLREQAFDQLVKVLQTDDVPVEEALDGIHDLMQGVGASPVQQDHFYPTLVDALGKRWPHHSRALLLRGRAQIRLAWNRRGNGYASAVTPEGWKGFERHLAAAERDIESSWRLDPTKTDACLQMMTVQLGKGGEPARMKMWFNRAMQADPACYEAARSMVWYLQPKWHGSVKEALEFGRQCVTSKQWKGAVPLALVDAHIYLASDTATGLKDKHWIQPGVWTDVRASYERYFEINPESSFVRQKYAYFAHKCRQYGPFLDLLPKLGRVDFSIFGGEAAFERMIQEAARETGRTPVRPQISASAAEASPGDAEPGMASPATETSPPPEALEPVKDR